MREMEGPNELTPTAYRQSSPVDKRQALEHGHGQAHSAPPPGAYYSHHQSLSPSGVRPPPLPHPLYSYYPGPPPGYHLTPDSRYPPGAYGPPHHSHANYHPGYWSQYPVSSPPPGAQHLPGQYPHVPVPAPSERIPSAGQYSSQPPHVSPGQYPPGQSYYPPPHHGLPMHHQSGPPAHLSAHSQYPGMHHPSQGHSAQHHPGQSPRFPSLPSPTLRPNSVSLTHSMARLDPDFRQKSPERTMGPSPGSTEQSPITEHGKYPQTTLPPVSLLPNFESARQSPIDGAVPGEGGIVPPYLDSPPARENLSCLVGSPDK